MDQVHRAHRAKELLNDDILQSAFSRLEDRAIEQLLRLRHSDDEQRRHLADFVNTIRYVKQSLQGEIDLLAVNQQNAKAKMNSGLGSQS